MNTCWDINDDAFSITLNKSRTLYFWILLKLQRCNEVKCDFLSIYHLLTPDIIQESKRKNKKKQQQSILVGQAICDINVNR